MIPDFKTYIKESVWGDIRKRGLGDESRKEDLISDIYDYLNMLYTTIHTNDEKIEYRDDKICVHLFKCKELNAYATLWIDNTKISFSSIAPDNYHKKGAYVQRLVKSIKNDLNDLYKKFKERYSPEVKEYTGLDCWYNFNLTSNDVKITKELCAEIIDFIFDNLADNDDIIRTLKKTVNESVWGDIRKRGLGDEVKEEDNVNNFGIKELLDYLKSTYKQSHFGKSFGRGILETSNNSISVPVIMDYRRGINMPQTFYLSITDNEQEKYISISPMLKDWTPEVYNLLKDNFTLNNVIKKQTKLISSHYIKVEPKDGSEVTNKFFLSVIDFILENVNDHKLCKLIERK